MSHSALVKQGNAICTKAKTAQSKGFGEYTREQRQGRSEREELEELVREVALPPIRAAAKELAALEGGREVDEVAEGLEEAVDEAEQDPLSVSASSPSDPFESVNEKAAQAGLKACSILA